MSVSNKVSKCIQIQARCVKKIKDLEGQIQLIKVRQPLLRYKPMSWDSTPYDLLRRELRSLRKVYDIQTYKINQYLLEKEQTWLLIE